MNVGEGEVFEKVILYLLENGRSSFILEIVAFSRAKTLANVAIGNMSNMLVKIDAEKTGAGKKMT